MKQLKSRPALLALPLLVLAMLAAGPPAPPADETDSVQGLLDGTAATVRLEGRIYRVRTLTIRRTLHLEGEGLATVLQFPANSLGIQLVRTPAGQGDRTVIRALCLRGGGGSDHTAHGLTVSAGRFLADDCMIEKFAGNGVELSGSNLWSLNRCGLRYNGGDGLHLSGSDVNVGLATQLDLVGNGGYAVREEGISLGSTYLACHAAANGAGAYSVGGENSFSLLLGCYSESGQKGSRWGQRTFSVGGNHGAGFDPAGSPGGHVGHDWMGFRLTRAQEVPLYGGPTVRAGSLPPATGSRGDVILNRLPSSGQPAGWSCTRSATKDGPAIWKAWGKIE